MRYLASAVGCLATLAFLAASMAMNWTFGFSLGQSEAESYAYGAVSVAADMMKAMLPFFIFWSLRNLRIDVTLVASMLWVICLLYALTSAFGFAALTREYVKVVRGSSVDLVSGLKRDLVSKEARAAELAATGNPKSIEKLLEGARMDQRWTSTKACTDVTADQSRLFCKKYHEQEATLAAAKEAVEVRSEIARLREAIAEKEQASGAASADPQVTLLARLIGYDLDWVSSRLTVLLVVLVEACSALGFFVSLNHGALIRRRTLTVSPAPAARHPEVSRDLMRSLEAPRPLERLAEVSEVVELEQGDVAKFALARTLFVEGEETAMPTLYRSYAVWCSETGTKPCSARDFYRRFADICRAVDLAVERKGGRQVCIGLQLAA